MMQFSKETSWMMFFKTSLKEFGAFRKTRQVDVLLLDNFNGLVTLLSTRQELKSSEASTTEMG